MNCKQGDLAIIVKSGAGNEGKIVTCLRLASKFECDRVSFICSTTNPAWVVDKQLCTAFGFDSNLVHDAQLRPIRDQDGEDEMIRIAGKPLKQELPQTTAISK